MLSKVEINKTIDEINKWKDPDKRKNIICSEHVSIPLNSRRSRRNANIGVFTSNEMEKQAFMERQLELAGSNYVVPDKDFVLYAKYEAYLKERGYKVIKLDSSIGLYEPTEGGSVSDSCMIRIQFKDWTKITDFEFVAEEKTVIFYDFSNNLAKKNLFLRKLFRDLYYYGNKEHEKNHHCKEYVTVFIDFTDMAVVPELQNYLATMRPYHINCILFMPDISTVKTIYPDDWEVVLGNCDTYLLMEYIDNKNIPYLLQEPMLPKLQKNQCFVAVRGCQIFIDNKYVEKG